ncbi:helix-turn-helix transcriptional regulator [Anaeromyxobacter paludicola]|nr:WYL domain-containing protein [Anaeromyxobacter paludicola]
MGRDTARYPPPGWSEVPALLPLARACQAGRLARIRYRDAGGHETEREVAVLGLGWRREGWLFAAFCELRQAWRLFRAERVLAIRVTRRRAPSAPAAFDGRRFATEDLSGPAPAGRVAVALDAPLARLAPALFPSALLERRGRGCVAHLRASAIDGVAGLCLSLGQGARVVSPPEAGALFAGLRAALERQRARRPEP